MSSIVDYYQTYWSEDGFRPQATTPAAVERLFRRHLPPGSRCLDVGCGDGRMSGLWCRDNGCDYTGVDISANAVEAAQGLGLTALQIDDAAKLPFPGESFDAVLCIEVLEHLFLPQVALSEIRRVLRPGGRLIATTPNVAYWRRRVDLALLGRWNPCGDDLSVAQPWRDPHIRFFNRGALKRLIQSVGFAHVRVGGHGGSFLRAVPWLGQRLGIRDGSVGYQLLQTVCPPVFGYRLDVVASRA